MKKNILILFILLFLLSACCKEDDITNSELFETIELIDENETQVTDISFYNDNYGVICGSNGFFAKTTDGGNTWNKLDVGINHTFLSTFMLDINTFYTARIGLYKTNNSGNNFNEIGNLSPITSSIFDIYFSNHLTGFIAHNGAIKKTIDGGNTWVEKYNTNQYYVISNLKFISENIGYGCGGGTFDSFNAGEIVKTTNEGETWNKILTTINITAISFINENIGFYSNVNKEIFKTIDGGISWINISTLDYYPTDILFQNNELGYVTTLEGKILITKNGGNTWQIAYENTDIAINKIIKTSNYIFAVGNNGLLIKSK